jgi:6-pyruvoyltetrahydropterin/6-carboxytetrahydropterin synthase
MKFKSTKVIELGSCAFRQWKADSHCRFVHGYRLVAKFTFGCVGLDDKNWVVDFGGLKALKILLEKDFDHTLCISADDPLLKNFKELHDLGGCDLRIFDKGVGIERFTEHCFNVADTYIREKTVGRCWVEKVEVWEHEKNSANIEYNLGDILPSCTDPKMSNKEIPETTTPAIADKQTPQMFTPQPVPVGNKTTTGYGNLFGSTTWGV